jgi:hypothetical protein
MTNQQQTWLIHLLDYEQQRMSFSGRLYLLKLAESAGIDVEVDFAELSMEYPEQVMQTTGGML